MDTRVQLALERTMLAWVRTGLALMGFGFVVARFSLLLRELIPRYGHLPQTPGLSLWMGIILIILGAAANIFAGISYAKNIDKLLHEQTLSSDHWPMGRVLAVTLSIIGFLMAFYLFVLR